MSDFAGRAAALPRAADALSTTEPGQIVVTEGIFCPSEQASAIEQEVTGALLALSYTAQTTAPAAG